MAAAARRAGSWRTAPRLLDFRRRSRVVSPSKTPREPAARVLWRWMIAIAELPASVRRSSSSVLRLLISCSSALFSWSTACTASRWQRRSAPSAGQQRALQQQGLLQHAGQRSLDARRRPSTSWSGSSRRASITPRVIGSELLPAASRLASVVGRAPVTSSPQHLQLGLVLFLDHWREPDARRGLGLRAVFAGALLAFAQHAVRKAAAAPGDDQVWQVRRLPQALRAIDEVSVALRPLSRL